VHPVDWTMITPRRSPAATKRRDQQTLLLCALGAFASSAINLPAADNDRRNVINLSATIPFHNAVMPHVEPGPALTERIIGLAIRVHRKLGPGLLEAVYQHCLCWELQHANLEFQREVPLQVIYEETRFNQAYFADIIVERTVLLELKSVERILPVHEAQTRTYVRLSGCHVGLLMNFNAVLLKDDLRRFIP
jgi:GxxExxY protein